MQGTGSSAAPVRDKMIEFLLWMAAHASEDNLVMINGDPRRVSHEIFDAAKKWLWKSLNKQLASSWQTRPFVATPCQKDTSHISRGSRTPGESSMITNASTVSPRAPRRISALT